MGRIAGKAGLAGDAIQYGYWGYLLYNEEYAKLSENVARDAPAVDVFFNAIEVVEQAASGDVKGAGWRLWQTLVPVLFVFDFF